MPWIDSFQVSQRGYGIDVLRNSGNDGENPDLGAQMLLQVIDLCGFKGRSILV